MMMDAFFFDTHCHLPDDLTDEAIEVIFRENREAGVGRMLLAGTDLDDCPRYLSLAARHPDLLVTAVGIHPEAADVWHDGLYGQLRQWAESPGVVAIGEVGLDAHYDATSAAVQEAVLIQCLKLADETGLPVVIHSREAFERCHAIIERHLAPDHPVQIHSFADGPDELDQWLKRNCYFSYNGMVTFKKAENIRETLRLVPEERLMLETDSPYLTPVPHRGKPNSSKYLPFVAERIAEERGRTKEQIMASTWRNAMRFFRLKDTTL